MAATVIRQWVSVGGASCDVRIGDGALELLGSILKGAVGRPHACALVVEEGASEGLVERVRRLLTDAGFEVRPVTLAAGAAGRTLDEALRLSQQLAGGRITSDDLICAIGGSDALSAVVHVADSWCGGTPLALVPLSLDACLECPTAPRGLDVANRHELVSVRPCAKHLICDLSVANCDPADERSVLMRALMAATALADGEKPVERLWDRAELVAAGDKEALAAQLADSVKSRGHIVSSTAVALRQTADFGQTFMRALSGLLGAGVSRGLLLAEGIRFQARLSAGMEELSVDDVLTIDELLDLLELAPLSCDLEPQQMVDALKAERFVRSGRFLLTLPKQIGRVRLSAVDDDLLLEHATAWCDTHR